MPGAVSQNGRGFRINFVEVAMLSSAGDAISLYLSDIAANLDYSVQQITFMEAE